MSTIPPSSQQPTSRENETSHTSTREGMPPKNRGINFSPTGISLREFANLAAAILRKLLNIEPLLVSIDKGSFFDKPFRWLYALIAILNLLLPVVFLMGGVNRGLLKEAPIAFLLVSAIHTLLGWLSFQLWWKRRSKIPQKALHGGESVATPIFAHFFQTLGEAAGITIGIGGFAFSLLFVCLPRETVYSFYEFHDLGIVTLLLSPICGFLIVLISRFIAEQFRALAEIANNTKATRR